MSISKSYFKLSIMSDKLHRLFLDVITNELSDLKIRDINSVQCMILYHAGLAKEKLFVGEFTQRGYYLGENVSYNIRKMVNNGYLIQFEDKDDRRRSYVKLSAKGVKLYEKLDDLFKVQSNDLIQSGINNNDLIELNERLTSIENIMKGMKSGKE